MSKRKLFVSSVVAVVTFGILYAAPGRVQRDGTVTPWRAMQLAEQKAGGKAIEAVYEFDDGHWGYAVYVAAKGKLWEVEMDKDSGKVGDVEQASPSGEAKELESDLKRAMRG